MKGLDDFIMGVHLSHYDDVRHKCPKCEQIKSIKMFFDMGGWFYVDDDPYCYHCETEMDIIEE